MDAKWYANNLHQRSRYFRIQVSFLPGQKLVGGFNPFENYYIVKLDSSSPRIGVNIPNMFEKPPPRYISMAVEPCHTPNQPRRNKKHTHG